MPEETKDEKRVKISVVEEPTPATATQENKDNTPKSPEMVVEKADKVPLWIMFLAFLLGLSLGAGLIGGLFYFRSKVEKLKPDDSKPTALATSTPEILPTSSPKPKLDLSQYSIQILNGSGIKGEASKVESLLKTAGFTQTQTGNASSYNYQETEIAVKKDFDPEVSEAVTTALTTYATKETTLTAASFDIVITVGSKKSSSDEL